MALIAIQGNNVEDVRHHLQDALTFIKEAMHKSEIDMALNLLAQGNAHDAEHEIEGLMGGE